MTTLRLTPAEHHELLEFFDQMKPSDKLPDHLKAVFAHGLDDAEIDRSAFGAMVAEDAPEAPGWQEGAGLVIEDLDTADVW